MKISSLVKELINLVIEFQEIEIGIFQEIEIGIFQEIETFCKIDQEMEKATRP